MAIEITCQCGRVIKAPDSAIGKKGRCKGCGREVEILPQVGDAPGVVDDEPMPDLAIKLDEEDAPQAPMPSSPSPPRPDAPNSAPTRARSVPRSNLRPLLWIFVVLNLIWILATPYSEIVQDQERDNKKSVYLLHNEFDDIRKLEEEKRDAHLQNAIRSQAAWICLTISIAGLAASDRHPER